jgi:hypothetical protein
MRRLFPIYISLLAAPSRLYKPWQAVGAPCEESSEQVEIPEEELSALDAEATRVGNSYRGIGILVGALGVAIVLIELLSTWPGLFGHWQPGMGKVKFVLMLLMAFLLWYSSKSRLHADWISKRFITERRRYACLDRLIKAYEHEEGASEATDSIGAVGVSLIREALENCRQQIAYNANWASRYRGIKRFSDHAGWLVFVLALLATAFVEFFADYPWLMVFTGILPAILVGIHGINGFLGIGNLADEHAEMARQLGEAHTKLSEIRAATECELSGMGEIRPALLTLTRNVYTMLVTRDSTWVKFARKMEVRAN